MNKTTNILYYGLAILSLKGISLVMMPIMTRYLSVSDYGMLNFLVSIASMLSIVLSLGLSELLYRFNSFKNNSQRLRFYKACLKVALCSAGLCFLFAIFFVDILVTLLPTQVSNEALRLLFINLGGSVVLALPLAILRIHGKAKVFMFTSVSQGVLQAILTLLLLEAGYGVVGVMFSGAAVVWFILFFLAWHYRAFISVNENSGTSITNEHGLYILSITLSSLFAYGLNGAENWFLVSFQGKETLAMYFVATQFALVTSIAFEPFRLWWFPQRFNTFQSNEQKAADIPLYGLAYALLIVITMMTLGPFMIDLLLPNEYAESKKILPWLCVVFFIKTISELLNLGCYYKNNAQAAPIINGLCAVLAILGCYLSLKYYDLYMMLYVLIAVHTIRSLMFLIRSQILVNLPYKYKYLICMISLLVAQTLLVSHYQLYALILFASACLIVLSVGFIQRKQVMHLLRG